MTTTVTRQHVREALARVQQVLADAAGADEQLTPEELTTTLATLAATERQAVDELAATLFSSGAIGPSGVSVQEIERAIAGVSSRLGISSLPGRPDVTALDAASLAAAKAAGEGLLALAQRFAGAPAAVLPPIDDAAFQGLAGAELLQAIRERCAPHVAFSYASARDAMFSRIDARDGKIVDVYRGREVPAVDRLTLANVHGVNTEHTHPQSQGIEDTVGKSDLHHLFPTDAEANGKRSSLPFGDVVGEVVWEKDGARLGHDAHGDLVFEPPEAHKGDAARALFYVAAVYGLPIPAREEAALRRWHGLDPVDEKERARNDAISALQENRNVFVDLPGLLDRLEDI